MFDVIKKKLFMLMIIPEIYFFSFHRIQLSLRSIGSGYLRFFKVVTGSVYLYSIRIFVGDSNPDPLRQITDDYVTIFEIYNNYMEMELALRLFFCSLVIHSLGFT